jgi:hypothetical protein
MPLCQHKLQQFSHVFDKPVTYYVEGIVNPKLQPLVKEEPKMSVFNNPKKLKIVHMTKVKKMKKVLNQVKEPCHYVFLLSNC